VLAARRCFKAQGAGWKGAIEADLKILAASRPTAVNLFWALDRMQKLIASLGVDNPEHDLLAEAQAIHEEDIAANYRMGELGAALIDSKSGAVLTHCNTGSLATGGYGTALGVIRSAFTAGRIAQVFADETRPWLQGARLTAWELVQDKIPVTLLADGAAAALMRQGQVSWVIVGADRIAANGDVANKIGTYPLAVLARYHDVPFYVAAPSSTFDWSLQRGDQIPIEQRAREEISMAGDRLMVPQAASVMNPAFDVTPADLVTAYVTEQGILTHPIKKVSDTFLAR
jgi:methylthioribose-1-phosphate isomerase